MGYLYKRCAILIIFTINSIILNNIAGHKRHASCKRTAVYIHRSVDCRYRIIIWASSRVFSEPENSSKYQERHGQKQTHHVTEQLQQVLAVRT